MASLERTSLLALALGAAAALGLVACGGGATPSCCPATPRSEINANLDTGQAAGRRRRLRRRRRRRAEVSAQVEALDGVDPKLKQALEEGAARLSEVVAELRRSDHRRRSEPTPETDVEPKKPKTREGKEAEEGEAGEGRGSRRRTAEAEEAADLPPQAEGKAEGTKRRRRAAGRSGSGDTAVRRGRPRQRRWEANDGGAEPSRAATRSATGSARAGCRTSTRRPT